MMGNEELINDIRGMIEDMLTIARSYNPDVRSIRTSISVHEHETYIDLHVVDVNEHEIAKYCDIIVDWED